MADRRQKVKRGLGAVLRSTTDRAEARDAEAEAPVAAKRAAKPAPESAPPSEGDKRHTSVYLYPAEFDMLDDMIYELRREHGLRIPKTELWRALLHLAGSMMKDPKRVDDLLAACSSVLEAEE